MCFTQIGKRIISVEQSLIAKPQCPLCRAFYTFTDLIRLKVKLLVDNEEDLAVDHETASIVALQNELNKKTEELEKLSSKNIDLEKSLSKLQFILSEERNEYMKLKYIHSHTGNTKDIYIKEIEKLKEHNQQLLADLEHIQKEKEITNKIDELLVNPMTKEFKEWADKIKKTKKPQESAQIFYKASVNMIEQLSTFSVKKKINSKNISQKIKSIITN